MIYIIGFILILGLVIFVHELGHFVMAKRAGILCHEFAIGMGPILFSKRKGETLYSLRLIPIGGFVMMAGEEVNEDFLKKDRNVLVTKNDKGEIDQIILSSDDPRFPEAEEVTVESYDLKGKEEAPMHLNGEPLADEAYYVMTKKRMRIAPFGRSFDSKSLPARFKTIFAGPFMNLVLAFFLFLLLGFLIGVPKDTLEIGQIQQDAPADGVFLPGDEVVRVAGPQGGEPADWAEFTGMLRNMRGERTWEIVVLRDGEEQTLKVVPLLAFNALGFRNMTEAEFHDLHGDEEVFDPDVVRVGRIADNSPAAGAVMTEGCAREQGEGLKRGDVILAVDGIEIEKWQTFIDIVEADYGPDADWRQKTYTFEILRDGEEHVLEIAPYPPEILGIQDVPALTVAMGVSRPTEFAFFQSFPQAFAFMGQSVMMIVGTLRLLFTGVAGVGDLAGPVGIAAITADVIQAGLITLINWVGLLSVNLAILNLLPIPALDGGRIVFLGYEAVTRRKPNKTIENYLHLIMFFLLIGLIIYVTYNDILRLLNIG